MHGYEKLKTNFHLLIKNISMFLKNSMSMESFAASFSV